MTENNKIPVHVSIIMDGNGRWAIQRGLQRWQGHPEGAESVRHVLKRAAKRGVRYLSLYAFSEENWNRSDIEVNALMSLLMDSMKKEVPLMMEEGVKLLVLGNRGRLNDNINATIDECMAKTAANSKLTMILFISYSGKWDILQAVKKIAARVQSEPDFSVDRLTMEDVSSALVTAGIPDPDLIIRTSGEYRLSNYLLWQTAYSEFYFTDTLWPDFREEEFDKALEAFAARDRRYGKTK